MAKKQISKQYGFSINLCYRTFEGITEELSEYTFIRSEPSAWYLVFRKGMGMFNYEITVHIGLEKENTQLTKATYIAEMFGIDTLGVLPSAINKFDQAFAKEVQREKIRSKPEIDSGTMCPVCYSPVLAGSLYCNIDGTPIARICPQCNLPNPPGSQYCSHCGKKLT